MSETITIKQAGEKREIRKIGEKEYDIAYFVYRI